MDLRRPSISRRVAKLAAFDGAVLGKNQPLMLETPSMSAPSRSGRSCGGRSTLCDVREETYRVRTALLALRAGRAARENMLREGKWFEGRENRRRTLQRGEQQENGCQLRQGRRARGRRLCVSVVAGVGKREGESRARPQRAGGEGGDSGPARRSHDPQTGPSQVTGSPS